MDPNQADLERLMLFEHARITAEANYNKNPNDADSPGNELYIKSLEATAKAPEMHMELHKHGGFQQAMAGGSATTKAEHSKKAVSSDLKYDICGWIILVVGIVSWVAMAKSNVPPTPR
uniref:Uncharacterized protein n=1 Tax=Daucus carota subsp. sativus TaxID=79200 RepID=A0A175YLB8_DAUCS